MSKRSTAELERTERQLRALVLAARSDGDEARARRLEAQATELVASARESR